MAAEAVTPAPARTEGQTAPLSDVGKPPHPAWIGPSRPWGWVKEYVPFPLSITATALPLRSVTVTESTAYQSLDDRDDSHRVPGAGVPGGTRTLPPSPASTELE